MNSLQDKLGQNNSAGIALVSGSENDQFIYPIAILPWLLHFNEKNFTYIPSHELSILESEIIDTHEKVIIILGLSGKKKLDEICTSLLEKMETSTTSKKVHIIIPQVNRNETTNSCVLLEKNKGSIRISTLASYKKFRNLPEGIHISPESLFNEEVWRYSNTHHSGIIKLLHDQQFQRNEK